MILPQGAGFDLESDDAPLDARTVAVPVAGPPKEEEIEDLFADLVEES
jgi:hypothetical protein